MSRINKRNCSTLQKAKKEKKAKNANGDVMRDLCCTLPYAVRCTSAAAAAAATSYLLYPIEIEIQFVPLMSNSNNTHERSHPTHWTSPENREQPPPRARARAPPAGRERGRGVLCSSGPLPFNVARAVSRDVRLLSRDLDLPAPLRFTKPPKGPVCIWLRIPCAALSGGLALQSCNC